MLERLVFDVQCSSFLLLACHECLYFLPFLLLRMVLSRFRDGTARLVSGVRESKLRQWVPILLLFVLVVYLFMGSACFWFFEHHRHEQNVRKWYMNLAVNRYALCHWMTSNIRLSLSLRLLCIFLPDLCFGVYGLPFWFIVVALLY